MADHIIPVQVRTARKRHRCDDCAEDIEPGDRYEHSVIPPHRLDVMDVDHWLTWRCHHPRNPGPGLFLLGCATAAAYREQQRRMLVEAGLLREAP